MANATGGSDRITNPIPVNVSFMSVAAVTADIVPNYIDSQTAFSCRPYSAGISYP